MPPFLTQMHLFSVLQVVPCVRLSLILSKTPSAFSENLSIEMAFLRLKQIVNDSSAVSCLERVVLSPYILKMYKNNNREQISHLKYRASKYYFCHNVFCVVIYFLDPNPQVEDFKFAEISSVLLVQCNGAD